MIALLRARPFKNVTLGSILLGLLILSAVGILTLYARTVPHRTRAEAFLLGFVELTPGQSTFAEAQEVARLSGGIPWYVDACGNMSCTFQNCALAFQFDNMPLSYVPRVGYTRLFAQVNVKNRIVVGREMEYERGAFRYELFDYASQLPAGWEYGIRRLKVDPLDERGTPHVLKEVLGPS